MIIIMLWLLFLSAFEHNKVLIDLFVSFIEGLGISVPQDLVLLHIVEM